MGKKTLEEISKILLVSFISILLSVQTTRRVLLDKKLDRSEFVEYKESHVKKHDDEHKATNEKLDLIIKLIEK